MDQAVTVTDPANAVRVARRLTADVMPRWCLRQEHVDDAILVVSEVVTNAIRHGTGPVLVRLRRLRRHVRVEVQDSAPEPPTVLPLHPDAVRGRGLNIVAALASRWGSTRVRGGKIVWVDLPCVAEPPCDEQRR